MSKKTITLLIIGGSAFLVFILVVFTILRMRTGAATQNTSVTPTPSNVEPTLILSENGTYITPYITGAEDLKVVKTTPQTQTKGVTTDSSLIIEFNKPFDKDSIIFSIVPPVEYNISGESKTMTVDFTKNLSPGTTYTFKVDPRETFPRTYTFTTAGPTPSLQPDTRPVGAARIEDDFNRTNNPDIYVASRTPYESSTFKIVKKYNTATRKFDFIVTIKGVTRQKAQTDVEAWFTSIGLSFEAYSMLKVTYQ